MSIAALAGAIAPVLLLVGIGVALRALGVLHREDSGVLNSVILYVALPALIFTSVAAAPLSMELVRAAGIAWAVSLAGLSVAWEIAHVLRLPARTAGGFVLAAALGNTGYLGYPVVQALLGRDALPAAVFYDVFGTVAVMFTLGIAVAARYGEHEGRIDVLKELITFPAVLALLAALAFRLLPLPLAVSATVMDWTGIAAKMAVPLIMVSLGVSLDFSALRGSLAPLAALAGVKLLLLPAIAVGVAVLTGDMDGMRVVALQAGMPSMMLAIVVGERFKLDTSFIAGAILVTTISCLVTIPLIQLLIP